MNTALTEPIQESGTVVPLLSVTERAVLLECEAKIRLGLKAFVDVGNALARIREERLYKERFGTFSDYCLAVWGISDRHARYLWSAAEVVGELASKNFAVLPQTESQARPLAELPKAEWAPAWEEVLGTAPGGQVTAKHVECVAKRRRLRLRGLDTAFLTRNPKPETRNPPVDAGTREERIRAATAAAQGKLRELQDLIRTADGEATANVALAIQFMDRLKEHVRRSEEMLSNRKAGA